MLLSAAMIVRDEAAVLDRCLRSIAGLVDEIVIVDTGSTDRSPEIARDHGAVVEIEPWAGDFSGPRNRSLDLARGEWILYIDADEYVRRGDADRVRAALTADEEHQGLRLPFVPRVGWTPYREARLWRHHPDIRFHGRIHESHTGALGRVARVEGRTVGHLDLLTIEHEGYEGDQSHKHARDEPLLHQALEEHPERLFYYDHLARIQEAQGRPAEAVATWRRGIAVAHRVGPQRDTRLLWINLAVHLLAHDRLDADLADLLEDALDRFPGIPALELAAAVHEFATGRAEAAVPRLEWILALTTDDLLATESSYDRRVVDEWPWNLLGLCRFELGDDAGAAVAFARAESAAPDNPAYRVRRRLAEARSGG
jgi:glycosyltransferase involved in cell wall biosynthesis